MNHRTPFADLNAVLKKVELENLEKGSTYPVTIVMDRYSGSYSGAQWLAFQSDPEDLPEEIGASDPDEEDFWRNHSDEQRPIGKGNTPNEAYMDLLPKLVVYYKKF